MLRLIHIIFYLFFVSVSIAVECHAASLHFLSAGNLIDTGKGSIDIRRVNLHEEIDRQQNLIEKIDGKEDRFLNLGRDYDINVLITNVIIHKTDALQDSLEFAETLDHRLKVKYLTGLQNLLKAYADGLKRKNLQKEKAVVLFDEYTDLMHADMRGESVAPLSVRFPYDTGEILLGNGSVFFDNKGYEASRTVLFRKFCGIYPWMILQKLESYADVPFADSLVKVAAYRDPNLFYNYAAATNTNLGKLIQKSNDKLVKILREMAVSPSGRLLYPFVDDILKGEIQFAQLDSVIYDSLQYFKMLVKAQIRHAERMNKGDTPIAYLDLTKMLERKGIEIYINTINGLHDETDKIRYAILEPLSSRELYYLLVLSEDVIYTSSYKGVYTRMMEKARNHGDSLLMSVQFDHFRKFIKMAAGYNKLDGFLATMPDASAQRMMIAFARGLEKTRALEDAVDVADSYSSILNKNVRDIIDREVIRSLSKSMTYGNRRGEIIYNILDNVFQSFSDTSINLSERLKINSVFKTNYEELKDSSGKVVQLVFFYGDKDGMESFANFMAMFNNADWKITKNKDWIEIHSQKGNPVSIYANLPLDNSKGDDPDAIAQENLLIYLSEKGIMPTIVIHRGHSYHVKSTIRQLPSSALIVILGSCGGYHNLEDVLKTCPDAQIISSKEVGTKAINEPILKAINENLRAGKNINWVNMWNSLSAQFASAESRERFDNYVPPHKNLGATFIKAYNRAMFEDYIE